MKLTRTITETIDIYWVSKNYLKFGKFKSARKRMGLSVTMACYWCHREFKDDDRLALVAISGRSNELFCQTCADTIEIE